MDMHEFPKKLDDLVQSPGGTKWDGPYMEKASSVPLDPWGEPYHYDCPGNHNKKGVDIYSYGPDKAPGGEGDNADITNW